ncbi:MAG: hypothetical protein HY079_07145, partial [Elusimicrobia bacterium]|nr:hypothetical protein [Elusimicrobiota bacterium]
PLLLAVALLTAAPCGAATVADWRASGVSDGMKEALRGEGLRLEDDGRVLDARTKAPLTADQLAAVLTRIDLGTRRLALERLELLLARDPLSPADRAAAEALKGDLPPEVAKALDARASAADLRRLTGSSLASIAAFFDQARTPAERRAAAAPVRAGAPGPRVPLPYFDDAERRAGDALRAAAARRLGADPFGRKVLARLAGDAGTPDLPPILVEDLSSDAARYDYRRRALVVDRASVLAAAAGVVPPKERPALTKSLASGPALNAYLAAHPEAVAAFAADNDALLVHELTHAWQDRRDPVMQEMARGNLPLALIVDDEVEAWTTKNLYVASRVANAPGAAIDPQEMADYRAMIASRPKWERALRARYRDAAVNAMDLDDAGAVQSRRVRAARARPAATRDEQTAKALDLAAMTRAQRELAASAAETRDRLTALSADADRAAAASAAPLARHYLALSLDAPNGVERAVLLQNAEEAALRSGDAALLAEVRAAKGRRR